MAKKLLTQTLRANMLVSALILIVSIPLFFRITEGLAVEDSDEALQLRKKEFLHYTLPTLQLDEIAFWNKVNRDVTILPEDQNLKRDSVFGQFFYDTLDAENEPYRVLLTPVTIEGRPFTFMARMNQIESEDFLNSITQLFVAVILMSLLGMYLITRWQSKRLWRPFYDTLTVMENFEIEKSQFIELGGSKTLEFERLNLVLRKLMEKNRRAFALQREFVDSAAHELQTPLAIMQTQIDMMMQRQDLNEAQGEMLENLESSISRLQRLNKNLLLLSKMESQVYAANEDISVTAILKSLLPFFQEQAIAQQIAFKTTVSEDLRLMANPALLEIAVSNLLLNAIRHNVFQGTVEIQLVKGKLRVTNTGIGEALPQEEVFQRFSKISSKSKGNGLGLSVVKKIADLNHWQLSYCFEDQKHVFSLDFNKA
ncbi:MAG: HAMP domain-containing histidine kinase [Bacteroidetes bacterium]|nr:HAMP domain-containing histidine kinase [Bacteroidota bacterium]